MLNSVVLVGKLTDRCVFDDTVDSSTSYRIRIICVNDDSCNELETDVYIWAGLADVVNNKADNCPAVGIKGYLKNVDGRLYIIAQRVSFIEVKEDD